MNMHQIAVQTANEKRRTVLFESYVKFSKIGYGTESSTGPEPNPALVIVNGMACLKDDEGNWSFTDKGKQHYIPLLAKCFTESDGRVQELMQNREMAENPEIRRVVNYMATVLAERDAAMELSP